MYSDRGEGKCPHCGATIKVSEYRMGVPGDIERSIPLPVLRADNVLYVKRYCLTKLQMVGLTYLLFLRNIW